MATGRLPELLVKVFDEHDVAAGRLGHRIEDIATVRRNGQAQTRDRPLT